MILQTATSTIIFDDTGRMSEYINHEETFEDKINRQAYERDKQINPQHYVS